MRLIRYQLNDSKISFGCIVNNEVWHLIGDPLSDYTIEYKIGNINEVKLLAPCQASKVVALAINFPGIDGYHDNMKEPMVFIKPSTSVCAPEEVIINPFPELPIWGEAELAVVIKNIPANATQEQVINGIYGFTIGNDVTVENIESRDHHLARSKCPDNFCPIGPWIDTEFDSSDCLIEAIQNNEVVRRGRSKEQVWKWPEIIAWLSTWMTLNPWDVILTGNPPDIGGLRLIEDGDIFSARIEGLGKLTNCFSIK
jgi:2-keto-4-pentenoate hydratase/2-oxohepta-3-ene-1,7-dioic acid hydratase in catechol pathway